MALLEVREPGLYCPAGDFYIDPSLPVERAVITHAHSDHAYPGSHRYLTAAPGEALLQARLGPDAVIESLPYRAPQRIGDVSVSLHPAGHILGSSQVRLDHRGEVWVISGDYKLSPDPTCAPFEPLRCHTFVTESTFALPVFRWPDEHSTFAAINAWWRANRDAGTMSVLFVYPVGKAQRVLAGLDTSIGPISASVSIERYNAIYRGQGIVLPETAAAAGLLLTASLEDDDLPDASRALASGWMRIEALRRRRSLDRGFALSDHADWPALLSAIEATGAGTVWVTHGYREPLAAWLREQGRDAVAIDTPFETSEAEA